MNDRELLELAAKAANISSYGFFHDEESDEMFFDIGSDEIIRWNPLADDGDALRLAVKLKIDILNHESFCGANAGELDSILNEDHMDDPMEATRRAIVRAAAEIGKSL